MKSFRGLIANGVMDIIPLHTNNGSTGYRIKKFQLMPHKFGASTGELESTVRIFSVQPPAYDSVTPVWDVVDFSDQELLGAAVINAEAVSDENPTVLHVVFDLMTFNQDIYITHQNNHADVGAVNYYIELEQVKLDLNQNTVATLKDIRNINP